MDSCCFTMVNIVQKHSPKKNHLICDHTTEVLATLILTYDNITNLFEYI